MPTIEDTKKYIRPSTPKSIFDRREMQKNDSAQEGRIKIISMLFQV